MHLYVLVCTCISYCHSYSKTELYYSCNVAMHCFQNKNCEFIDMNLSFILNEAKHLMSQKLDLHVCT